MAAGPPAKIPGSTWRSPQTAWEDENVKIKNIFGTMFSGALGKDMVAATWHGHEYIRAYRKPKDPHTPSQEEERAIYRQAVDTWKTLRNRQKEFYRRIAKGMSGYNLFVQRYILAVREGKEPEVPIQLLYVTADGAPIPEGELVVRMRSRSLFTDGLEDGKGEIALTPSDVPYIFSLRRGTREDVVLTMEDLLETDVPMVLESKTLGIKLVWSVPVPPGEPGTETK
jgi:hypothetical protein